MRRRHVATNFGRVLGVTLIVSLLATSAPTAAPTLVDIAKEAERTTVSRAHDSAALSIVRRWLAYGSAQYWSLTVNNVGAKSTANHEPSASYSPLVISPAPVVIDAPTNLTVTATANTESGEENGSLVFYEKANNTYPKVTLSEGRHVKDRVTSVPAMPQIGPETRKAFDDFRKAGRTVYFLAFFHTHPNFPYSGESRSGEPSGDDIQYQSDHGNVLGILRTGKGYSFFSNGKTFWPKDPEANECIWILNKRK